MAIQDEVVSIFDTIHPRWAARPLKAFLSGEDIRACYSHRAEKPDGSIDAAKALVLTHKALIVIDIVAANGGYDGFPSETLHARTIPLRRISSHSYVAELQEGTTRDSREAVSASLEIKLADPEEVVRLPFADDDHGGAHSGKRISMINEFADALTP